MWDLDQDAWLEQQREFVTRKAEEWQLPDGSVYPSREEADPNDHYEWADVSVRDEVKARYVVVGVNQD